MTKNDASHLLLCPIAAVARNGVIGGGGGMVWHVPLDLRYFMRMTLGKPLVMGRKSYEALKKPLPGRANIVITRRPDKLRADRKKYASILNKVPERQGPGTLDVMATLDEALHLARQAALRLATDEIMIGGGGEIYALTLPLADRLYLTELEMEAAGDAYFPAFDRAQWQETSRERHPATDSSPALSFVRYDRVS